MTGAAVAQGPPGDAGPPDNVDLGPPDDVDPGPPENVTTGPPEGVAEFVDTSPLSGPDEVEPVSLSGKIRVESQHLENTTAELVRNSSTEFTLDITVTGNATNVTFFLNKQAVEASQDIENVTMEVDGEPAEFGVNESGGESWIVFEIEQFSTRTVAFTSDGADGGGLFDEQDIPVGGVEATPTNTGELDPSLYEDVSGDGDGLDPTQAVNWWNELAQNPDEFDDLTQEQVDALDWSGDGELSPEDAVLLWSEQVQDGE